MKKLFLKIPSHTDINGMWHCSLSANSLVDFLRLTGLALKDEYDVIPVITLDFIILNEDGTIIRP